MLHEKQTVALRSMYASAGMTVAKFIVGIMTGSLGLISEALHSLLDFGATIITYMAVRISDKPADDTHHYGHGKIESIAALAETFLLFLTSIWIVYEALQRLFFSAHVHPVIFSWWAVAVILGSIVIDYFRARELSRGAQETRSQALEADALHFSSDILSSSVVLIGFAFIALGWPQADSIAALGVAIFVCKAAWDLGKRTIDSLIDAAPVGVKETVTSIAQDIPSIIALDSLRARPAGSALFIDLEITISRSLPLDRLKQTKDILSQRIIEKFPQAQVAIVANPIILDNETVHEKVHIIARNLHLAVHHVTVHDIVGVISVSLDLEVEGHKTLQEAHDLATQLENAIRQELGEGIEVETHIEPLHTHELIGEDVAQDTLHEVTQLIIKSAQEFTSSLCDIHDVRVRKTAAGHIIIFHCLADKNLSVEDVHNTIDALERRIRTQYPQAWRVIGHAEPYRH